MAVTLKYGSSGSDVKKLQEELNKNGYSLDVDGQFGSKTQSAVQSYQKSKGLTVDGIVGTNTWNALNSGSSQTTTTTSNQTSSQSTATKTQATRPTYKQGALVTEAQKTLDEWESVKKPTDYTSPYADKINQTLDAILNGEKFTYDFNVDPLYQQLEDNFVKQGKMAMQDATAQAAALSGGYGSSYGTTAGTQAYLQNMNELNELVPDLQERAYQAYVNSQNQLAQNLALLQQQEADAYGKYRDEVGDYNTERDYLYNKLANERDIDWSKYLQEVSGYESDRDYNESVRQYEEQFDYQKERDKVSDEQWQKSYELSKASKSSSGGGSNSSYTNTVSASELEKMEDELESISGDFKDANGKIGANYRLAERIDYYQKVYGLSDDMADALYERYCYDMPAVN